MKVRLLTTLAGPGFSAGPGDEIEVTSADGKRLVKLGRAEPVVLPRTSRMERAIQFARGGNAWRTNQ